ncbi:hypothetical protein [Actinomadura oligospora]|uniref:hypothetical protein n=1 Tax=Actinomadura oligospora TaxID=111804 RepID=UPI0012FC9BF1|nr:hypothetical protein [Actinomadura oligospora]
MSMQPVDRKAGPPQVSARASTPMPAPEAALDSASRTLFPPPAPAPHLVPTPVAPRPVWDGSSAANPTGGPFHAAAPRVYTTMVAGDIVAFTDARRDEEIRRHLRHRLYEDLREAFTMTLLPWDACYREDRGDGALIVVPPDAPPHLLLDPLAHHLQAMLRRGNRFASDPARMRVRMAVHSGHVEKDDHGVVGRAVNHLFRLVDAPRFREAAAGSGAELSMIASDLLYDEVLSSRGVLFPELYRQVEVSCKETTARGWIWLSPGGCFPDPAATPDQA